MNSKALKRYIDIAVKIEVRRIFDAGSFEYLSKKLRLALSFLGNSLGTIDAEENIRDARDLLHEAHLLSQNKDSMSWETPEDKVYLAKGRLAKAISFIKPERAKNPKDANNCRSILIEVIRSL
jgi:hypothetical protein